MVQGAGNPMLEGAYRRPWGKVERWGGGSRGRTDSKRLRVAFGANKRGDKIMEIEKGTGGHNKEKKSAVSLDSFTVHVRANKEDSVRVSEVLKHGAVEFKRKPGQEIGAKRN